METIAAFGDSVLKGVIYENEHYRVADTSFQKICEDSFGITVENKARFGSTITRGEKIFEKNLELIRECSGQYVILEFGGNDCDFNWKEISESGKYNTKMVPENHITYLAINYTGILADKNLRLAIAHCVDKEAMSKASYGGLTEIAHGMFNPTYVFGAPSDPIEYEYDLDKAKEYLVKAGYPDGVDIGKILCIGGGYHEKNCIVLQADLAKIGITVAIEPMEQAAAIAQAATGDFDLFTCGYSCQSDYDFWRAITHTESNANGFVKFADAPAELGLNADKIDALYEQASVELDRDVRKKLYKELDDTLMETVTYLPIFYRSSTYAWNKDLNTVLHSNYYYVYDFSWNTAK